MAITNLSSNIELHTTKYDLIKDAFITINRFGQDEEMDNYSYQFASRTLNRMLKNWMADGFQLWLKQVCYLFPQPNQVAYSMHENMTDNFTADTYVKTFTTADGGIGDTFIIVSDVTGITAGDYIGVTLDTDYRYWTRVLSVVGNTINFVVGGALPSISTNGHIVITYTNKLKNPAYVYSGTRSIDYITDIPMDYLSYEEYFELPNKQGTSASMPVSYMYSRLLEETVITLWPNPTTADMLVKFVVSQKVTNLDINANEPDFPEEWHEAIILNLAARLCAAYGKNTGDKFGNLKAEAAESYIRAKSFDNEVGSIYLRPDNRHG
jgi:hypothetical protein